jgi:molecular chaperone DnaJ
MRLRLSGEGEGGQLGGPPGDLYVVMVVEPHDLFERDGTDLHLSLPISAFQAMIGTQLTVTTILGDERPVEVPTGAQHGDTVRLRGGGMPKVDSHSRGDLYVHLGVVIPRRLSAEQRRLIEEASRLGGGEELESQGGIFERLKRAFGGE